MIDFVLTTECLQKCGLSQIIRCYSSAMTDSELFLVFSQLDAALFDVASRAVVAITPMFPLKITSIKSDDHCLVSGTADGFVVSTAVSGHAGTQRYAVADSPVLYVGLSRRIGCIFFQSARRVSEINLNRREVVVSLSRVSSSTFRCLSTAAGALIVQREFRMVSSALS